MVVNTGPMWVSCQCGKVDPNSGSMGIGESGGEFPRMELNPYRYLENTSGVSVRVSSYGMSVSTSK